jgi:hypothetical protein
VVWLECHFELVADQFEVVALVLLVPHALVRFDSMGLLAMELLAVGARILLWLVVLLLLLFSVATLQLGALGFLALTCAWLAFFLGQVAGGAQRMFEARGLLFVATQQS